MRQVVRAGPADGFFEGRDPVAPERVSATFATERPDHPVLRTFSGPPG